MDKKFIAGVFRIGLPLVGFIMAMLSLAILAVLLSGCSAYDPNYDTRTTPTATVVTAADNTPTPEGAVVTVRGNVYVRDNSGDVQGWLEAGTVVKAVCKDEWCVVKEGQFTGLKFWRGCSTDNPDNSGCKKEN